MSQHFESSKREEIIDEVITETRKPYIPGVSEPIPVAKNNDS